MIMNVPSSKTAIMKSQEFSFRTEKQTIFLKYFSFLRVIIYLTANRTRKESVNRARSNPSTPPSSRRPSAEFGGQEVLFQSAGAPTKRTPPPLASIVFFRRKEHESNKFRFLKNLVCYKHIKYSLFVRPSEK